MAPTTASDAKPGRSVYQFSLRMLFVLAVIFAALALVVRQLMQLSGKDAAAIVASCAGGLAIGVGVCFACYLLREIDGFKVMGTLALISAVALVGVVCRDRWLWYCFGLILGISVWMQGRRAVNVLLGFLGWSRGPGRDRSPP